MVMNVLAVLSWLGGTDLCHKYHRKASLAQVKIKIQNLK